VDSVNLTTYLFALLKAKLEAAKVTEHEFEVKVQIKEPIKFEINGLARSVIDLS